MKAARFYSKGDIRIEDIEAPVPKDGQVLVEVEWCGICGTDLHEWVAGPLYIGTKDRPHPLTGGYVPVTMGHEFCGRVKTAPANCELKVGQAVMVDPRLNCKTCHPCRSGTPNLCQQAAFLGLHGAGGGGFSELVAVDTNMCYALPESVRLRDAALIEPLAVGRHAVNATGVADFSELSVLILGGGPIGLSVMYNLRAIGVGKVIVSEPTAQRQASAKDLADHVFNPLLIDLPGECKKLTDNRGVDVVFDCAGVPAGLTAGVEALKAKGMYMNVAGWEQPFEVPFAATMIKEVIIKYSMAYDDYDFRSVVDDFSAGKYKGVEQMTTSRIALDDVAKLGFDELITQKDRHMKILVTPKPELLSA